MYDATEPPCSVGAGSMEREAPRRRAARGRLKEDGNDPDGSRTRDLWIRRANAHGSSSIIEHRYGMSRLLLRKQRLIGEIGPDSGRIVELRFFRGSRTARWPHLIVESVPSLSALGEPWEWPAGFSVGARPPRRGESPNGPARFADRPLVVLNNAIIAGCCASRDIALHGNALLR